jgi:hypothetical protein|tara:strand:- start:432 stop:611 length:180 start_codon:yes stop_codon:yes gene_type:complete
MANGGSSASAQACVEMHMFNLELLANLAAVLGGVGSFIYFSYRIWSTRKGVKPKDKPDG